MTVDGIGLDLFLRYSAVDRRGASQPKMRPDSASGARARRQVALPAERLRERMEGAGESAARQLGERLPFVQGHDRLPVLARERKSDARVHGLLNVLGSDLGLAIGAVDQDADPLAAVALPKVGDEAVGVANRWQLVVDDDENGRRRIEGVDERRLGPRHVEHDIPVVAEREVDQRANALQIDRAWGRARPRGRCQEVQTRGCANDQTSEKRLVETMRVLQRFEHRESRLDAEERPGVARRQVQVDEQHLAGRLSKRLRQIDGDRRGADAALGADNREYAPFHRRGLLQQAADRRFDALLGDRFRHAFVDARAHRLEHQGGIERRTNDRNPHGGVVTLDVGDDRQQIPLLPHVDQDDVGHRGQAPHRRRELVRSEQH